MKFLLNPSIFVPLLRQLFCHNFSTKPARNLAKVARSRPESGEYLAICSPLRPDTCGRTFRVRREVTYAGLRRDLGENKKNRFQI